MLAVLTSAPIAATGSYPNDSVDPRSQRIVLGAITLGLTFSPRLDSHECELRARRRPHRGHPFMPQRLGRSSLGN